MHKTKERPNETENSTLNKIYKLHVHLVGVRRMSLLTVLLFFSRSFTSLHDRTFEKTMFDDDESLTGSNNITLITLALDGFAFEVSFISTALFYF